MLGNILKSSSLYAIGTVARTSSSIIMLPIYTRYLSPDIYGTAELLNLILDLTVLLLGARITAGMFRFYADQESLEDKHTVLSTCLWLGFAVNAIAICALWVAAPLIADLLSNPSITKALRWFIFTLAFGTIGEIGMGYFRVNDQAGRYLTVSLFKLAIQIAASLYFIVYKELGLWGIIYSALVSAGVQATVLLAVVLPVIGLRFSTYIANALISYSLPIIFGSIGMYYMTFGDRYFLQYFHDAAAVGIYALGYKFGFMLIALVWSPFMSYWDAKQFDHATEADGAVLFSRVFYVANYILWAAATGMLLFAGPVIHIMADAAYYPATNVVPIIVIAYVLQSWTAFHRFGILQSKKTFYINRYTWITVAIVSVLYIVLIPKYGGMGAAVATLIAMFLRFLLIYRKSQEYYAFTTNWKKIGILFLLSGLGYCSTFWLYQNQSIDLGLGMIPYLIVILASLLINCAPFSVREIFNLIRYRRMPPVQ